MAKIIIGKNNEAVHKIIARRLVKILAHEEKPFDSTLFKVPEGETPQLIVHPVSQSVYESRNAKKYTCTLCRSQLECEYAFDSYNTDGDCLAIK